MEQKTTTPTVTIERLTDWKLVLSKARKTMGMGDAVKEPSTEWKKKILMARHSPIRVLEFNVSIENLKSWVSVHLVRHNQGIRHFVQSQRDDRNEGRAVSRDDMPQSTLVKHDMVLNAESIINISRKRLCMQASLETRQVWKLVVEELKKIGETELASFCQPECWWMGGECPEMKPCGMCPSKALPQE